ncbi:hypothetical protein [Streptomyces sp. KS 21]|nr:hypothetical protein [Streptomyces sp. KS 21]
MDVKPILNWIAHTKGWMPGYEITSSSGGPNFTTNNLTVSGG